ncbi:MAG: hypothetical protein JO297_20650 [Nitrososphaeraceae archaeon]|nr:hypothetical protein [Nitrososphaeraceae archaeon]
MSKDLYNDPFKDPIVGRIIAKEREIRRRIDAAVDGKSEEEELNKLYNKRYNIFLAAEKMPIHPLMKVIFSNMAGDVKLELLLFKLRQGFEEQISRIINRIDSIEDEIKTMKENLNTNLR